MNAAKPQRPISVEMAVERLLADIETFSEELSVAGHRRCSVNSDYYLRQPHRMTLADDATLLHAALVAADRGEAETCFSAMKLLTSRYLERNEAQVQRIAEEIDRDSERHQREMRVGRLQGGVRELAA